MSSIAAGQIVPSEAPRPLEPADLAPLTERSLELLDAAAEVADVDPSLLHATPARDLTDRLLELIAALRALDVNAVVRRQGWWSRMLGADLEARLRLEVACRNLATISGNAALAAGEARTAGSKLWRTRRQVEDDLARLDAILAVLSKALPQTGDAEPQLRARFERRVANLVTLQASHRLTLEQLGLAIDNLRGLLDRYGEVERLLVPLWQHNALAASHGASAALAPPSAFGSLRSMHGDIAGQAERIMQGIAP